MARPTRIVLHVSTGGAEEEGEVSVWRSSIAAVRSSVGRSKLLVSAAAGLVSSCLRVLFSSVPGTTGLGLGP